jgi:hypothetical protein
VHHLTRAAAATLLALAAAGCGDGSPKPLPTHPVGGKVTLDGRPLAGAEIWLVPTSEGVRDAAITIRPYARSGPDGAFAVTSYLENDGAPAGEYAVMVVPAGRPARADDEDPEQPRPGGKGGPRPPPFPAKYKSPKLSGLTATVRAGPNQIDLDLKSK